MAVQIAKQSSVEGQNKPAVHQSDSLANTLFIRVNPYDPQNPCDYAFG
jgi:hypothetical protein